jgi:hypothetical protein
MERELFTTILQRKLQSSLRELEIVGRSVGSGMGVGDGEMGVVGGGVESVRSLWMERVSSAVEKIDLVDWEGVGELSCSSLSCRDEIETEVETEEEDVDMEGDVGVDDVVSGVEREGGGGGGDEHYHYYQPPVQGVEQYVFTPIRHRGSQASLSTILDTEIGSVFSEGGGIGECEIADDDFDDDDDGDSIIDLDEPMVVYHNHSQQQQQQQQQQHQYQQNELYPHFTQLYTSSSSSHEMDNSVLQETLGLSSPFGYTYTPFASSYVPPVTTSHFESSTSLSPPSSSSSSSHSSASFGEATLSHHPSEPRFHPGETTTHPHSLHRPLRRRTGFMLDRPIGINGREILPQVQEGIPTPPVWVGVESGFDVASGVSQNGIPTHVGAANIDFETASQSTAAQQQPAPSNTIFGQTGPQLTAELANLVVEERRNRESTGNPIGFDHERRSVSRSSRKQHKSILKRKSSRVNMTQAQSLQLLVQSVMGQIGRWTRDS